MARPTLSMNPTGWFQVAWSTEVGERAVLRMTYFGRDLVAWRSESGEVSVMDAYCGHLGTHLGHSGHVEGDRIVCPFHGWEWKGQGRNVCIPYQGRTHRGRRIRTFAVVERDESIYIWHDLERRAPYFDVPDVFTAFGDGGTAAGYYPAHPQAVIDQSAADIEISRFQRYTEPPSLAAAENEGFRKLRRWARQFYPDDGTAGSRDGADRSTSTPPRTVVHEEAPTP